jgi:hypothetical protein
VSRLGLALLGVLLASCASAGPYARCGGDAHCSTGQCTEVSLTRTDGTTATGAFCSAACQADTDCPAGGACIALAHDPTATFFCAQRCASAGDCDGLACTTLATTTGETLSTCLP